MKRQIGCIPMVFLVCALSCSPAAAGILYDNGLINGTINAWEISSPYEVANSFTLSDTATLTGVDFSIWIPSGDTPFSVQWGISTSADYTNSAGGGGAPVALLTNTMQCSGCVWIDDLYISHISLPDIVLAPGTYWLSFRNATTAHESSMYWDISNGPSVAIVNTLGNVQDELVPGSNSNSFQLQGDVANPEPATLFLFLPAFVVGVFVHRRIRDRQTAEI